MVAGVWEVKMHLGGGTWAQLKKGMWQMENGGASVQCCGTLSDSRAPVLITMSTRPTHCAPFSPTAAGGGHKRCFMGSSPDIWLKPRQDWTSQVNTDIMRGLPGPLAATQCSGAFSDTIILRFFPFNFTDSVCPQSFWDYVSREKQGPKKSLIYQVISAHKNHIHLLLSARHGSREESTIAKSIEAGHP